MITTKKYIFILAVLTIVISLLMLSCDKEVFNGYEVETENLSGTLSVNSNPKGVSIYCDGRITGFVTPAVLEYLEPGDHIIMLKMYLYNDTTFTVVVEDSISSEIYIDLNSNSSNLGKIVCESIPSGSEIFLNDSSTGNTTPDTLINIVPGIYEVRYDLISHRSDSTNIIVRPQEMTFYSTNLSDTTYWVDYMMNNSNIPTNSFNDVIEYKNEIFFASGTHGLIKYDGKDWTVYSLANLGTSLSSINRLFLKDDDLWACIDGQLAKFNDGFVGSYKHEFLSPDFFDAALDNRGNIWCGSRNGVIKFDGANWTILENDSIDLTYVSVLKVDANNDLFIGTAYHDDERPGYASGILCKYGNSNFDVMINTGSYYSPVSVTSIDFDNENRVWVGKTTGIWNQKCEIMHSSQNGLLVKFELQNEPVGNSYNIYNRFQFDDENRLWISSQIGVILVYPSGINEFYNSYNSNLPDNVFSSIHVTDNNIIWITSINSGVTKYKMR